MWLESNMTSPITRQACKPADLVGQCDLWLVLDVSGSMASDAASAHISEQTGLSINDLSCYTALALLKAMHAVKPRHYTFGAIFYDVDVRYVHHRQLLTPEGIRSLECAMRQKALPGNLTNWSRPLHEVLTEITQQQTHVIFLTDGMPNSEQDTIETILSTNVPTDNNLSLHTIALGYGGIDMHQLTRMTAIVKERQSPKCMAECRGGVYFIASVTEIMDVVMTLATSILVKQSNSRFALLSGQAERDPSETRFIKLLTELLAMVRPKRSRYLSTNEFVMSEASLLQAAQRVKDYEAEGAGNLTEDEFQLAFVPKNFTQWGYSWLVALYDAHVSMQVRNKHDKTCIRYKALHEDWEEVHEKVRQAFESMPMPEPMVKNRSVFSRQPAVRSCGSVANTAHTQSQPARTMSSVYQASEGCVHGDTKILTPDGYVHARDVVKGDVLLCCPLQLGGTPEHVEVDMILEVQQDKSVLCVVDGVRITQHHPIVLQGSARWVFPCDVCDGYDYSVDEHMYTYALKRANGSARPGWFMAQGGASMLHVAALGHMIKGPVIEHPFFGTERVTDDLRRYCMDGKVSITKEWVVRDGLVCAIRMPGEAADAADVAGAADMTDTVDLTDATDATGAAEATTHGQKPTITHEDDEICGTECSVN